LLRFEENLFLECARADEQFEDLKEKPLLHRIVTYRIDVEDAGCEASKPSSLWNTSVQQDSNQF